MLFAQTYNFSTWPNTCITFFLDCLCLDYVIIMSDLFLQRTAGLVVTHMNGIMVEHQQQITHMKLSLSSSRRGSVSPVSMSGYVTLNYKTFKITTVVVVVVINDNLCVLGTLPV